MLCGCLFHFPFKIPKKKFLEFFWQILKVHFNKDDRKYFILRKCFRVNLNTFGEIKSVLKAWNNFMLRKGLQ
jgi:hypothetical protein